MFWKKVKDFIKGILIKLPLRNIILFESYPDLSDNTMPVFEELVRRGYNKKYKFVWICSDTPRKDYPIIHNVKYIQPYKNKIRWRYYIWFSKVILCCNVFYGCGRKDQTVIYLMHGASLKSTRSYYTCPENVNYMITSGVGLTDIDSYELDIDISKCVALGYPRNDALFDRIVLSDYFGKFEKYIVWYPTVKQFKGGLKTGSVQPIPIVYDEHNAILLNKVAAANNILIIVKPHFAQITENIRKFELSNIRFINDEFFKDNGISSYQFVGSCDALLTDYSSIYYDYLNVDKPIGLIWEDLDDYKKNPGVIKDFDSYMIGGEKIYNIEELCEFIGRVSNGEDKLREERKKINRLANVSDVPDNTKRVVDFITDTCI